MNKSISLPKALLWLTITVTHPLSAHASDALSQWMAALRRATDVKSGTTDSALRARPSEMLSVITPMVGGMTATYAEAFKPTIDYIGETAGSESSRMNRAGDCPATMSQNECNAQVASYMKWRDTERIDEQRAARARLDAANKNSSLDLLGALATRRSSSTRVERMLDQRYNFLSDFEKRLIRLDEGIIKAAKKADSTLDKLKQKFKQPEMNLRATTQTAEVPKVATRVQTGMPEAYKQELAEKAQRQREERRQRQEVERQRPPPGNCWNNLDRGGAIDCTPWRQPERQQTTTQCLSWGNRPGGPLPGLHEPFDPNKFVCHQWGSLNASPIIAPSSSGVDQQCIQNVLPRVGGDLQSAQFLCSSQGAPLQPVRP